jgi:hypothetical protein
MINLLRTLGLAADASQQEIADALEACRQRGLHDLDGVSLDRLQGVLSVGERQAHYRRVHEQYAAIASTLHLLDLPGASDNHRWRDRLVEFTDD